MAVVMNEKSKSFASIDDEEDALLNEAISCSHNLDIKTEDEEDPDYKPTLNSKPWYDRTSDSSSNMSDLSVSNGKINLSGDNSTIEDKKVIEEEEVDQNVLNAKCDPDDVLKIKCDSEDVEDMNYEVEDTEMDDVLEDDNAAMDEHVADTNGRTHKRIREDNDDDSNVPKNRRNSTSSSSTMSSTGKKPTEYETDPIVLARRQKDVDYGKNTVGYDKYLEEIPKEERARDHPRTPPMHLKCSRRAWDGMVKLWRKQLHFWDPKDEPKSDEKDIKS